MNKKQEQSLRRAAILIASLDQDSADRLIEQLPTEQRARVRRMLPELDDVDEAERRSVIDEFFRAAAPAASRPGAGVELDPGLASRLGVDPRPASRPTPRPTAQAASAGAPFQFLCDLSVDRLASLVNGERPQTIALVVSHLPGPRACELLESLPAGLQAEVMRRWIDLDAADPEVLRDVERGLEQRLSLHLEDERRRCSGLSAVSRILESAPAATRRRLLGNLRHCDPRLAAQLGQQRFEFADLERLNDYSLAEVLKAADAEIAILALAGAAESLVSRVLDNLPPREARLLRGALENLGPTPLSDIEHAQQALADLASDLDAQGRIARARTRPEPALA